MEEYFKFIKIQLLENTVEFYKLFLVKRMKNRALCHTLTPN